MKRAGLAALLLAVSPLTIGCGSDPTCDEVDDLEAQLADMEPDDPDFNDVTEDLAQALADCNS